jgi:hypothetical protein
LEVKMRVHTIVRAVLVATVIAASAVGPSATPAVDTALPIQPGCPDGCRPAVTDYDGDLDEVVRN